MQLSCLISVNVRAGRRRWVQSFILIQTHERDVRQVQSHGYRRKPSYYLETDVTLRIR